jgi:Tfp pilus assembly protein PilO
MLRNFNWPWANGAMATRGPRFWLQTACGVLAVANLFALFIYVAPPGGSRRQLLEERSQIGNQIRAARASTTRLRNVAAKVQLGSTESTAFESNYFLPTRTAYEAIIAETQRMAQASGLQQRDGVNTEEPIEGSADLSVLNIAANYEGSYESLMHFLYEADRSPMLLMLDTLQVAPQQRGGQITASVRFQSIIREEPSLGSGGQP